LGRQIIDARNNLLNPSRQVPRTNRKRKQFRHNYRFTNTAFSATCLGFLYDIPPVQGYLSDAAINYGVDMAKSKSKNQNYISIWIGRTGSSRTKRKGRAHPGKHLSVPLEGKNKNAQQDAPSQSRLVVTECLLLRMF
jgi:hypothetical protein